MLRDSGLKTVPIQHPVSEVTIAGDLAKHVSNALIPASDLEFRGFARRAVAILIEDMSIAGE